MFGIVICCAAFAAKITWNRRRLRELAAKIPGPKGLPILGQGHLLLNKNCKEIFKVLTTVTEGFTSDLAKIWVGPELVIFAETPDALKVVLNSQECLAKSKFYDLLILKKGLLINSGDMWRHHRKVLTPAFRLSVLQSLVPLFDQKSRALVKNLTKLCGVKKFDV